MNPRDLAALVQRWLSNEGGLLQQAVAETVSFGHFSRADCIFALHALRKTVTGPALETWLEGQKEAGSPREVLVLHAGNLPLVGFQDVLAVLVSGHRYHGKLSKKDPYLAASFLELASREVPDRIGSWSTRPEALSGPFDALLFSGSEAGAPEVLDWLNAKRLLKEGAATLIRTARFSIARVDELNEFTMPELTQAMLRYGGRGCRSVAVVVCPQPLRPNQCGMVDHAESFWMSSPSPAKNQLASVYQAYYRASGRNLTLVDHFMLVEADPDPSVPDTVFYVRGGDEAVAALLDRFGPRVQTVYTADARLLNGRPTERLDEAQTPPVWWRPDGTDTLGWLLALS